MGFPQAGEINEAFVKDVTLELDHERQNFDVWKWEDMALRKKRNQDLEEEKLGAYREVYR